MTPRRPTKAMVRVEPAWATLLGSLRENRYWKDPTKNITKKTIPAIREITWRML